MRWFRGSGFEDRAASGYFGRCDECGLDIVSNGYGGPRETWEPVRYVVRWRLWPRRWVWKYHEDCAVLARARQGSA